MFYTYGDELSPEEARRNLEKFGKVATTFLLVLGIKSAVSYAVDLPKSDLSPTDGKPTKEMTPDHGKVHGLPIDEKGRTPKTEKNALALRDSIVNMPKRKNIIWFDNGMYQGGTDRGYNSANIFDKDTNTIAVFRKDENGEYNRFTTTCRLTKTERKYLFSSKGNFVTGNNLNNPEVFPILKNLTNKETEK